MSGNDENCPFYNSDRRDIKTHQVAVEGIMKWVEVNDAVAIYVIGNYYDGSGGLQQDLEKAMELYARAAELDNRKASYNLACIYDGGGDLK
jgi:TPR repeat protein